MTAHGKSGQRFLRHKQQREGHDEHDPAGKRMEESLGRSRTDVGIDLFNLFNGNSVLTQSGTYSVSNLSSWGTPTSVQQPRLFKFTVSLNY